MLTNPVLDPFGRFRSSSTVPKVTPGGSLLERMSFGGGVLLPEHQQQPVR